MDKVLTDFANIAATIVESLILSVPEPDSPLYWLMLGSLLMLLALLMMWLLVRMRRARLVREQATAPAPEMSFSDVSAEAAAAGADASPEPEPEHEAVQVVEAEPEQDKSPPAATQDMVATMEEKVAEMANISGTASPGGHKTSPGTGKGTGEGSGFRFFKRKGKAAAATPDGIDPEDDVFLLGLEQEMLATRQLYLDGLISKEVYVTETRALYDKAQSRMT